MAICDYIGCLCHMVDVVSLYEKRSASHGFCCGRQGMCVCQKTLLCNFSFSKWHWISFFLRACPVPTLFRSETLVRGFVYRPKSLFIDLTHYWCDNRLQNMAYAAHMTTAWKAKGDWLELVALSVLMMGLVLR